MTTYTHASYNEAMRQLQRNKRTNDQSLLTWDAGDGWTGKGYWCPRRGRIIVKTVSASGFEVI
jgi:hypothetical protein